MKTILNTPISMLVAILLLICTGQEATSKERDLVPSNSLRAEHHLLLKSLDQLEMFIEIAAKTSKDPDRDALLSSDTSVLSKAMERNGLFWRDPYKVRPRGRWWLASLVNPAARDAALSLEVRASVAKAIERAIARDKAFKYGIRRGRLSPKTQKTVATFIAMGRRFATNFEVYYPHPGPRVPR